MKLRIYRAIRTNLLTQNFGEINTRPEVMDIYKNLGMKGHDGQDWGVNCKNNSVKIGGQCENVYCDINCEAEITYIQKDVKNGFGIIAVSKNDDGIFKHLWWHFDSINPELKVGSKIKSGDFLGVAGNTGNSTGAHLHRGLYPYSEPYDNGYHGAVDITNYFTGICIVDYMNILKTQISVIQKIINFLLGKK